MKKRVLFLLRSDTGNLGLINIYNYLRKLNFVIVLYCQSNNPLNVHMFSGLKIEDNPERIRKDFEKFDYIICHRNCFYFNEFWQELLETRAIIISDNTTGYEGNNIYGDYVLTSPFNKTIPWIPNERFFQCKPTKLIRDKCKTGKKIILFVDSGHFPFSKKGKNQIALFLKKISLEKDYSIVVKPRYLYGEQGSALHVNKMHLFDFIKQIFDGNLPNNLILLDKHIPLSEIISKSDICITTYSSSIVEAAFQKKHIVNLRDIINNETCELRKNRFKMIQEYIDELGVTQNTKNFCVQNISATSVDLDVYEDWKVCLNRIFQRDNNQEKQSILKSRIIAKEKFFLSKYEFYFDDYNTFQDFLLSHLQFCGTKKFFSDFKKRMYEYFSINNYFINNAFNYSAMLEYFFESKEYALLKHYTFVESHKYFPFLSFYKMFIYEREHDLTNAKKELKKYITHINKLDYFKYITELNHGIIDIICYEKALDND